MTERAVLMLSGLAVAALLGGCAEADPPASTGAEIVRTRCTRCHSTERIKAGAARDRAYWETTVDRMRGNGARIDDAQRATLVEFLASGGAAGL
ncbi:MAG: hypothetical protein C0418_00180 [Coriobacteriaceae bacterium]|nr:hypothetical protein [Coriobacteriaceae bacterium]